MATTTLTTDQATRPLAEGEQIAYQVGRTVIRLQCVRPDAAYTVVTEQGTRRIASWSAAYPHEHLAREAAAHTARAFREHGDAVMIESYRNTLAVALQQEMARSVRRMSSPHRIALLEAQLAAVADLGTRNAALDAYAAA